jgi:hypothetical protein
MEIPIPSYEKRLMHSGTIVGTKNLTISNVGESFCDLGLDCKKNASGARISLQKNIFDYI